MEQRILEGFLREVLANGYHVHGAAVRHHGKLVDEEVLVPEGRIQLFSASKTWTAMAVGIAMGEGKLKLQDRFVDLMREELPAKLPEGYEELTVWHLLTMSTGHEGCPVFQMQERMRKAWEQDHPGQEAPRAHYADNWWEAFTTTPLAVSPGEHHWTYNNGTTYALARIVEKKSGESLRDYLMPRVFAPLQIEKPEWDTDSQGHCLGATGLHLNTEELSRGGQLLLDRGKCGGKQLIPEEFVLEMTRKQVENPQGGTDEEARAGYGYQMWMCTHPGTYRMDGMFSQFSIGVPDHDAVIGITCHEPVHGFDVLRLVWTEVLPRLKERV